MKQIYQHMLLWFLLLGGVYGHNCLVGPNVTSTLTTEWRLISGLDAAGSYSWFTQLQEAAQPPLVSVLSDSENQDIQNVLDGVCELVSFFELVSEAESGSTLHELLAAIVKDSCQWLDYLVSTHQNVTSSDEFSSLPPSCNACDATRIHHYCLQRTIRGEQLRHLIHRSLFDRLHMYYSDATPASRSREWVQTSSFTEEQKDRILNNI